MAGGGPAVPWGWVAMQAAGAALFFFALQRFVLQSTVETGLVWGAVGGIGAGWLAWRQMRGT